MYGMYNTRKNLRSFFNRHVDIWKSIIPLDAGITFFEVLPSGVFFILFLGGTQWVSAKYHGIILIF